MNHPHSAYINRELSWLEFDQRVLDQAKYERVPLLERLKFLAITASNLDEFFMVRVGGLRVQQGRQPDLTDPTGLTPSEQLLAIYERVDQMIHDQYQCFLEQIEPNLAAEGFQRISMPSATAIHRSAAQRVFDEEIVSVISPISIDPAAPFPLLVNLGLYLCVLIAARTPIDEEYDEILEYETSIHKPRFAFIPLGKAISRFVTLPSEKGFAYALLEDVVATFVELFFPNAVVDNMEDNATPAVVGIGSAPSPHAPKSANGPSDTVSPPSSVLSSLSPRNSDVS